MAAIAIEIDKERLRTFCQKWKVTEFALFGSAVRPDEFRPSREPRVARAIDSYLSREP